MDSFHHGYRLWVSMRLQVMPLYSVQQCHAANSKQQDPCRSCRKPLTDESDRSMGGKPAFSNILNTHPVSSIFSWLLFFCFHFIHMFFQNVFRYLIISAVALLFVKSIFLIKIWLFIFSNQTLSPSGRPLDHHLMREDHAAVYLFTPLNIFHTPSPWYPWVTVTAGL